MLGAERHLRIVGALQHIALACDFVVEQARAAGLDERAIHHCYLAVDEACTNIVEHGYHAYPPDDPGIIDIFCQFDDEALTITLLDDGEPFDPLQRPTPDPHTPIAQRPAGGWGIFFIRKLMDEVAYSYENGRNRLIMVKRIGASAREPLRAGTESLKPIDIEPRVAGVWQVTPRGALRDHAAKQLEAVLLRQLEGGHYRLILDMSEIEAVSSGALKMLVAVWQRTREHKGDLVLTSLRQEVHESLQSVGLDLVFTIYADADQALTTFTA